MAILILLIGIFLRLICLDAPLVGDELASVSIWAQMPFWKIPVEYRNTNNHIFNTLILSAILKVFGLKHFLLRLPLLIFGALSLVLCYSTTLKITNNKSVAIGALSLLAVSGTHILYSTYSRGYILVMLIGQISVDLFLPISRNNPDVTFVPTDRPFRGREIVFLGIIWFIGTWTLPTFAIFEVSLLVFFGLSLVFSFRDKFFNLRFPYTQICLTLLFGLAGFYFQYFFLIPREKLKFAFSFASESTGAMFLIEMVKIFIFPLYSLGYFFLLAMAVGLFSLFKKNINLFSLLFTLLLLIPVSIQINNMIHLVGVDPPPRVFNYLQPFFFACASWGVFLIIQTIYGWLFKSPFLPQQTTSRGVHGAFCIMLMPIIFSYAMEFKNNAYPEIKAREPYHKIQEFVEKLGPQDLFLASNKSHVWFYLYGANEMRKRVDNIIEKGELGNIYILEYVSKGKSDIKRISHNGVPYFQLRDYLPINHGGEVEALVLPVAMLQLATRYPGFNIFRIDPIFIRKNYELKAGYNLKHWIIPGNFSSPQFKQVKTASGTQPAISFSEPCALLSRDVDVPRKNFFSLNLYFICSTSSNKNGVSYFSGTVRDNQIFLNPTWSLNDWVMDHPFGRGIIPRDWYPMVFLSVSGASHEIIQMDDSSPNSSVLVRGIQSYKISWSEEE